MRGGNAGSVMNRVRGGAIRTVCFLACLTMAAGLLTGCSRDAGEDAAKRPSVTGVVVSMLGPSRVDEVYEAQGTVRSDRTSMIASRVMGAVTSLDVREGEQVKAGQVLLTLDDTDARQRARAAEMAADAASRNRTLAGATWRRYQGLFEKQAVSRQEMDEVQARKDMADAEYERARAMADEARTYLAFTRIVAPAPGVVTAKHIDVGSMANPGMPLLTIEGLGDAYVEMHADESLSGRIRPGMAVKVVVDALDKTLEGSIREVLPDIDPATRTFRVKIDTREKDLRTGLFVRVLVPVGSRDILAVPAAAVVRKGQLSGVYVVTDKGVVTYRLIKEGPATPAGIEVLSGLKPGDRVITSGMERAVDGGVVAEDAR
ncbi:MAG TPA: efflux RND transporter periplasmic adaptor subunit [Deltaproteobacteria bacterium]|nr:efflux RND transporter periplasmic adaptor subunit [Deltaproteobacteria bacterium]